MAVYKFDDKAIYKLGVAISNQLEKRYVKKTTYNSALYEIKNLESRISNLELLLKLNDYQTSSDVQDIVNSSVMEVVDLIPSKVSELENDSEYMGTTEVVEMIHEIIGSEIEDSLNKLY